MVKGTDLQHAIQGANLDQRLDHNEPPHIVRSEPKPGDEIPHVQIEAEEVGGGFRRVVAGTRRIEPRKPHEASGSFVEFTKPDGSIGHGVE